MKRRRIRRLWTWQIIEAGVCVHYTATRAEALRFIGEDSDVMRVRLSLYLPRIVWDYR